jgi:hypothetical protein
VTTGTAGYVTFPVTTKNINPGTYTATLSSTPAIAGVTLEGTTIAIARPTGAAADSIDGAGSIRVNVAATVEAKDYETLVLTLSGGTAPNVLADPVPSVPAFKLTVDAASGTPTVPGTPVVSHTAGNGRVTLSWPAPTNGGSPIIRYELSVDTLTTGPAANAYMSIGTALTHTPTGLTNGTQYRFFVRAVNAIGPGLSQPVLATPQAPSGGGGGGGGGSSSNRPLPPANTTTATPPTSVGGGAGVVAESTTSGAITSAISDGDSEAVITLTGNNGTAAFSGSSINALVGADMGLRLEGQGITVLLPARVLADNVTPTTESIRISLTAPSETVVTRAATAIGRADAVQRIAEVTLTVDGRAVTQFDRLVTVVVDVTGLGLSASDRLSAFRLENNDGVTLFGGSLSSDGNSFSFQTDRFSTYGVMSGVNLTSLRFVVDSTSFTRNGSSQTIDAAPFIEGGRTLVPLRAIAEGLGATVTWNEATRTVGLSLSGRSLNLNIGQEQSQIVQNRTFVPLRYVSETLGANVVWDGGARAVNIHQG